MADDFSDPTGMKEALVESSKEFAKEGAQTVFGLVKSICGPAAEEFGFMLQDQVKYYRSRNLNRLAKKFDELGYGKRSQEQIASPRVAMQLLEAASWVDDDGLIEMWAGLLNSTLSPDGKDDSNLVFTEFLKKMTLVQAKILEWVCRNCEVTIENGIIWSDSYKTLLVDDFSKEIGCADLLRLDREVDHLRSLELLDGTFNVKANPLTVSLSPTALGLQLFARSHGKLNLEEFYKSQLVTK